MTKTCFIKTAKIESQTFFKVTNSNKPEMSMLYKVYSV